MDEMPQQDAPIHSESTAEHSTLTDDFHRLNSLIPSDQDVVSVRPSTTVAEAVHLMLENNYSQIPVVEGSHVLGVFSFRSLTRTSVGMESVPQNLRELPVDEFLEQFRFFHIHHDIREELLDSLNQDDGVLVGQPDRLQGIVTAMDVLSYLYRIASPFVLLQEIELSLRKLIDFCVDEDEFETCVERSLCHRYEEEDLPSELTDLTFDEYVQIIGDGRNWPQFEVAFGSSSDLHRKRTRAKLVEVRSIRNDMLHFRRAFTRQDYETLSVYRDWLLMKSRMLEAKSEGLNHE